MSERNAPDGGSEIEIEEPGSGAGRSEAGGSKPGPGNASATDDAVATLENELQGEIQALQDRFLRLQAEFDNYRKREARERAAAWARAKADLAQKLLSAIDDLQRVAHFDPQNVTASAVLEGVGLVERKLLDTLEREGLTRVGEVGEAFDPNLHEAIGILPAPSPEQDDHVAAVAIPGYRFGEQLLRPAQVQVYRHADTG